MEQVDVKEQLEALRDQKETFLSLVKSPGWDRLVSVMSAQAKARAKECALIPIKSIDHALRRNTQLGIILGLRLAAMMPRVILEEKQSEFEALLEEIRDATERDSGPFGG